MPSSAGWRRRTPIVAGLVVTVLAGLALTVARHAPRPPVAPRAAIRAALHDPATARALAGSRWNRVSAAPLDAQLERVSFWAGEQIVAQAAVNGRAQVVQAQDFHAERVPYGDWIAYEPALLIGLGAIFLAVTLVVPWRRVRNLDALAAQSLVVSVVLFQRRYLDPSLVAAAPGLLYLMARCAWLALGRAPRAAPSTPLLIAVSPRMSPGRRIRWLRVALLVLGIVFVMVGVSSPFAVDVTYAVMEGATVLIHGVLPYGHLPPGILHGDTYPILSYALYTPLALIAPVRSEWNSVDAALVVAVTAALVGAWAALRSVAAGSRRNRRPDAEEAGLRAAIAVLAFPALLITVSTGTTDIVLAAMLGLALLLWRRPAAGSALLAVAGWFKLAPFALLPLFLAPLRGRRLAAGLVASAVVSLAVLALVVSLGGGRGIVEMAHAVSYQFTRGSDQSLWSALGIGGLQPLAQACVLGLIAVGALALWRDPGLADEPRRVAAICASVLIGLQLAADYWAFLYVVWVVPALCVSVLAPGIPEVPAWPVLAPADAAPATREEALAA
ncbi:MAG TPA: glycosyltransferase 87 family protein [Solirubrobacteraceae bacterium]|nr:glycosyltransferase 87 family protein [Solirubrobacteraceae bacterium]